MKSFLQSVGRRGPIVMSAAAFLLVLLARATGWDRGLKDEGAVAHLWQLLIGLQLPIIVAFVATADWRRPSGALMVLGVQALALAVAMAPVAMLRL